VLVSCHPLKLLGQEICAMEGAISEIESVGTG
jgi:hypothetical protein